MHGGHDRRDQRVAAASRQHLVADGHVLDRPVAHRRADHGPRDQTLVGVAHDADVVVLAGEEDILIPVRLSLRLHEAIPSSTWATVPGGHACLWESPDAFNRTFIAFVTSSAS